jgi:hypothetical protein
MINPFQIVDTLLDAGKVLIGAPATIKERIEKTLSETFTSPFLAALAQGKILVSEHALDHELRNRVGEDGHMKLGSIRCMDDHIEALVTGKKLMAEVAGEYRVRIQDLSINPNTQHLRMEILSESYEGKNFLGQCAIAVGGSLLKSMIRKEVSNSELGQVLEFEEEDKFILNLGELDAIKSLKSNLLPGVPASALDLVHCTRANHVNGGIQVKLGHSEKLLSFIEEPLSLLKKTLR